MKLTHFRRVVFMHSDRTSDPPADSPRVALETDREQVATGEEFAPVEVAAESAPGTAHLAPDLIFIGLACLGFLLIVALLSLVSGAPFVAPTERVSPAIGMNCMVPLAVTLAGYAAAQIVYQRLGGGGRGRAARLRELAIDGYLIGLFVVIMFGHFHLKMWMPIINPALFDAGYLTVDDALHFLISGAGWIRRAVIVVLPGADSWYQAGLLAMFALSFWFHAVGKRQWYYHNMTAILLLEMVGPLTYLVAPAVGPFVFEQGPSAIATAAQATMHAGFLQAQAGGGAWLAQHGGDYFTAPPAAMPSLHVAVAWVMTYYAIKARSAVSPIMVLLLGWITVESVVLRWHYLVDLPAGLLLAGAVIVVTNRVCRHRLEVPAVRLRASAQGR
jgi:hypothetical protein